MNPPLTPHVLAAALGQFPPTDAQARVIAAPLEPALVVAGAGSGKTETMAGRVVWLVANGLVRRDEVLGLTFTRKAAGELAERIHRRLQRLGEFERRGLVPLLPELHARGALDVFAELERAGAGDRARHDALDRLGGADATAREPAGPAAAADGLLDRPVVATYNSFADQIVREHAVRAGSDPDAAVLSESAAWLLMRRVVLDSDDPRLESRPESLGTIVDGALRIARDAVDNLVDLDELGRFAGRFAQIVERPSENARVTVYEPVLRAVQVVGGLEVLVTLAREYAAQKRRRGVIDFSDQVAGAYRLVRDHRAVRDELQARHRVVLLDEYQDTSVVQTDLLAAAFRCGAVMAVGDPHQSIYGWRGASAGNLGGFGAAFGEHGEARRFSLMTSWRNGRRVLDAAQAVLAPLASSSPVPVEPLEPRPGAPDGVVEIAVEQDADAEADRVAEWFARVRAERSGPTTGAVLLRSKKHMTRFADALARRGIPHRILGLGGLLATPEVVDVISALRVISDPHAGSALIRLLSGPRWAVGLTDLRALADLARRLVRHDAALQPLDDALRGGDDAGSLIDALDFVGRSAPDHGWLRDLTPEAVLRLREAAGVFAALRAQAGLPIAELVRLIEVELRLDIELAANESRGPARVASDQLRAFVDELHGFLSTDENASLTSLLAWLDRAEKLDELAPRTEPPEDDVVQLLTIHGSKGLEWDAVAIVRLVGDELPAMVRESKGWLRFGVLPYAFRGDAAWLPECAWASAQTQQQLKAAFDAFEQGVRARHVDEERRLAYVAVTRARDRLLLSASPWSGTKRPRPLSPFLVEMAEALGMPLPDVEVGDNPYLDARALLQWPLDPLGGRRARVESAAALVAEAAADRAEPDRDLALLLAERAERERPAAVTVPDRIPASRFADVRRDPGVLARPLPERPYRQTRVGTLFHAWVEQRAGLTGAGPLLDDGLFGDGLLGDDLWDDGLGGGGPGGDDAGRTTPLSDAERMERLQQAFLGSEWAGLQPIEVESEIDFVVPDALGDGRPRVVICKLDAVYRRGDRIEIVDWKTGRPPRTAAQRDERMLQLELYRRAYHEARGVPLDRIDVALFYVADGIVLRG